MAFLAPALVACVADDEGVAAADGVLDRGLSADPETLDPQHARSVAAAKILGDLYEPLLTLNAAGARVPGAASAWEISQEGRKYLFYLRKNGRWSNGDPVRAADFVHAFRTLVAPDTHAFYGDSLSMLKNAAAISAAKLPPEELGVKALSATELELTLERPAAELLAVLTHPSTAPRHESAPANGAGGAAYPVPSNGAYRLVDRVVATSIELEKNPFFHAAGTVRVGRVRYVPLDDEMAEYHRFRAGDLDLTSRVPAAMMSQVDPARLRIAPYLGVYYLAYNMRLPPAKDAPALRRALALGVDAGLITESITRRGELPASSWVPPGITGYQPAAGAVSQAERERRAKELYREAGYGPDRPLEITLRYNTSEENRRIAVALQSMWRETLGVELTLQQQEFKVMLAATRAGREPGLSRGSWIADYADPMNFLAIFGSTHPSNPAGYASAEFDRLLGAANTATETAERYDFLRRAEAQLLRDQPVIPIYFYVSKHLVQSGIDGWEDNPLDYHYSRYLGFADSG